MKKFLVLFLSLAFLTACSNDDDNDQTGTDPIIGTWVVIEASAPLNTQFCFDKQSTMTFNSNSTGQATLYFTQTQCTATSSPGTWTNNGNSAYTISVPVLGNLQGTANFTANNRFIFTTTVAGVPGTLTFQKQ